MFGENARENDIPVNRLRKASDDMRSQGDGKGNSTRARAQLSLERALEYIDVDEFVEATPKICDCGKKFSTRTSASVREIARDEVCEN